MDVGKLRVVRVWEVTPHIYRVYIYSIYIYLHVYIHIFACIYIHLQVYIYISICQYTHLYTPRGLWLGNMGKSEQRATSRVGNNCQLYTEYTVRRAWERNGAHHQFFFSCSIRFGCFQK